jgi:hypothetical protein
VKPEELIAVCYTTWLFLGKLGGLGFDGVSVLFKLGNGSLGIMDFEDAIYFANGGLFL